MKGKIFVTSTGYDPEKGKDVKDPYLGPKPSLGACRPDIRRQLEKGDQIFVVSGKVQSVDQFVIGGFEIESKITAIQAYDRFPEQRLRVGENGQVTGNVIIDARGKQHKLDHHEKNTFDKRIENYVVGCNPIALITPEEITEGRRRTLEILRDVFDIKGNSIRELLGRNRNMSESQVLKLRAHLEDVKKMARPCSPAELLRRVTNAARLAT
ncbi:hypothetical protein [Zavarzinella formosa]|uniref:hypothetical protein n=1 Tax=Zavarzinella formosa TaxID=360055 RepID=UPI0002DED089|nr:hypothetical protein [Zavarzinella formosa]